MRGPRGHCHGRGVVGSHPSVLAVCAPCRYVHCGDMRYSPRLLGNPHLAAFRGADAVFADTTYCNPRYSFPSQVRPRGQTPMAPEP